MLHAELLVGSIQALGKVHSIRDLDVDASERRTQAAHPFDGHTQVDDMLEDADKNDEIGLSTTRRGGEQSSRSNRDSMKPLGSKRTCRRGVEALHVGETVIAQQGEQATGRASHFQDARILEREKGPDRIRNAPKSIPVFDATFAPTMFVLVLGGLAIVTVEIVLAWKVVGETETAILTDRDVVPREKVVVD